MKIRDIVAIFSAMLLVSMQSAFATDFYWDANGAAANTGGNGTWDASSLLWRNGSSTGTLEAWPNTDPNTDNARLAGTAGTLTLNSGSTNINVNTITFGANYTIAAPGSGTAVLNLSGTTPTIAVGTTTDTIAAKITGSAGLTKTGTGTLTLSGVNTFSGGTVINAGQVTVSSDANLGATSGGITFNGNATLAAISLTLNSARTVTLNNSAIVSFLGNTTDYNITIPGKVTGSGGINMGSGSYNVVTLSNTGNDFTGPITIGGSNNNQAALTVASLWDSASPIKFGNMTGNNTAPLRNSITFSGSAAPLVFNNRWFELTGLSTAANANIVNNNATANTLTINTDLRVTTTGDKLLYLQGSNTGNNTFAGAITNGSSAVVSLTKADAGTWVLSANNTYSGGTALTAGKLQWVVGGSSSNSALTVSAGTLSVSVTDTNLQWTCKSLTHTAASTLEFAFGGNTPSATVAPLQVNGNVMLVVAPTVNCTGTTLPAGTYPLMTWTGAFSGVAPSTVTLSSGRGILVKDDTTKTLWLNVQGTRGALTWQGPANSIWNVNQSGNTIWKDAALVTTYYQENTPVSLLIGDSVVFGTTGAGIVNLNTIVNPAAVSVNANTPNNYTISGTGSIAGGGSLTKTGTGTLTLSTTNGYSGGTSLGAGTLSIGINDALGTGSVVLGGGTIQSIDSTARTLNNPVVLNGSTTVGGSGNLSFTSTGAGAVPANSTITVTSSGVNATIATALSGAGSITKAGAGTLTLTGTNTYSGGTTVSAGRLVVDGGLIRHTAAAVSVGAATMVITNGAKVFSGGAPSAIGTSGSGTPLKVVGGSGATSLWDLGNQHLGVGYVSGPTSFVIDGAGVAGSAVVTNINVLQWGTASGFSTANTSILLTNGALMFVNGDVRLGSTYYSSSAINNSIRIVGGAVDSIFYGKSGGAFYVGYGDRPNSSYNQVVVGSGGVMTNVGYHASTPENDFVIGWANTGTGSGTAWSNQLVVTDGGKVFAARNLTIGWASGNDSSTRSNALVIANGGLVNAPGAIYLGVSATGTGFTLGGFNGLAITSGGQLFTGADSIVGYAKANGQTNISNTAWISGANSLWNLGNKNLTVGSKTGTGVATGNVLRVTAGGVVTNISVLTVSANNTLSLGAGGQIYAGTVTNSGIMAVTIDASQTPACGCLNVTNRLNVSTASLNISATGKPVGVFVIASYKTLIAPAVFAATNGLPENCKLYMDYNGLKQIAIVGTSKGTLIQLY